MEFNPARVDDACVVIPAYNEAGMIATVVSLARSRFRDVVVVDDGSADDTAALAAAAGALVVRHPGNLGQGAALQTGISFGLAHTRARFLVTFDADGQHDIADAEAMVAHARDHDLQVVLGSRFLGDQAQVPAGRRRVLRAAAAFTRRTTGLEVTDAHNGLRVLRRDAAAGLRLRLHGMAHASELLHQIARGGWSWAEHPVTIAYTDYSRAKGQRSFNALNIAWDLLHDRLRAPA